MKHPKLFVAGKVIDTKAGVANMQIEAQKELDNLFGQGNSAVNIVHHPNDKSWSIKIYRQYPQEEQYEVPRPMWASGETEIYYRDAFILAGNIGKEVVNFGYMPFADSGYRYYLAESDFLFYWNHAAKELGFSKAKAVHFNNDPLFFEIKMTF